MSHAEQIADARAVLEELSESLEDLATVLAGIEAAQGSSDEDKHDDEPSAKDDEQPAAEVSHDPEADLDYAIAWVSQAMDAMSSELSTMDVLALPDTLTSLDEILRHLAEVDQGSQSERLREAAQIASNVHAAAQIATELGEFVDGSHQAHRGLTAIKDYTALIDALASLLGHIEERHDAPR